MHNYLLALNATPMESVVTDTLYLQSASLWEETFRCIAPSYIPVLFSFDESFRQYLPCWQCQGKYARAVSDGNGNVISGMEPILVKYTSLDINEALSTRAFVPDKSTMGIFNSVRDLSNLSLPSEDNALISDINASKSFDYIIMLNFRIPSRQKMRFSVMLVPNYSSNLSIPTPSLLDNIYNLIGCVLSPISNMSAYEINAKPLDLQLEGPSIVEQYRSLAKSSLTGLAKCAMDALVKIRQSERRSKILKNWYASQQK